jgi:hypothetical protein
MTAPLPRPDHPTPTRAAGDLERAHRHGVGAAVAGMTDAAPAPTRPPATPFP